MTSAKEKEPVFLPFFNSLYYMDYGGCFSLDGQLAYFLFTQVSGINSTLQVAISFSISLYLSVYLANMIVQSLLARVQLPFKLASYIRQSARTGEKYHGQQELGSQLVSQLAIIHFRPISDLTMNLELDLAQGLPPTRQFTENYCGIAIGLSIFRH